MKTSFPLALLASLALAGMLRADDSVKVPLDRAELPAGSFLKLHRLIAPRPDESKWAAIPWMTDLAAARRKAAREDRPLFVWRAGGGEVLGRA